ncbi:MAG: hypothetical protein FWB96_01400 [Defluviitaleaceae bacterium]|nr:hypothetical protein [Defluviitaleaceae bacterium]MCL2261651.1 hypothetical protein [Defluviitaleaceae bacterium]
MPGDEIKGKIMSEIKSLIKWIKDEFIGLRQDLKYAEGKKIKPHILYGATVSRHKVGYICLYGDLHTGVAGFGGTPQAACDDFDTAWENYKHEWHTKKYCTITNPENLEYGHSMCQECNDCGGGHGYDGE